jgi:hypothetical protein
MYGQLEAINEMAVRGTGIHTHPLDWLSPEAQANFTKLRAMKSNFFPFMATDGYYAADPALTQRQQDALSKTYSWELAPGITITDPGSSYYQPPDPNSAAMTPPVWPGPSGEPGDTNVFMGPQQ